MEDVVKHDIPSDQKLSQVATPPLSEQHLKLFKIISLMFLGVIVIVVLIMIGVQIGRMQTLSNISSLIEQTKEQTNNKSTLTESDIQITPTSEIVTITEEVSPSYGSVVRITPASIEGWKLAQNNGVYFKIPANATCNSNTECTEVSYPNVYQGVTSLLPARILLTVTDYSGGSRRAQYIANYKGVQECKPIYVESKFGLVSALQIAVDGGWCQSGYDGGIVAVIGKKFVVIGPGLSYNEKKEINRWAERDTLISTLSTK